MNNIDKSKLQLNKPQGLNFSGANTAPQK